MAPPIINFASPKAGRARLVKDDGQRGCCSDLECHSGALMQQQADISDCRIPNVYDPVDGVLTVPPSDRWMQSKRYGLMALMASAYMIETFQSHVPESQAYKLTLLRRVSQLTLYGYVAFVESFVHFKTIQQQLKDMLPTKVRERWNNTPDWLQCCLVYVGFGLGPMIFLEMSNSSPSDAVLAIFATVLCLSVPLELRLGYEEGDHAFQGGSLKKWCNGTYALLHALDEVVALILVIHLLKTGHAVKNETALGRSVMGMQIAVDLSWAVFSAHHVFHQHEHHEGGNACECDDDHSDHGHVIDAPSATFRVFIKGVAIAVPVVVMSTLLIDINTQLGEQESLWCVMLLSVYSHLTLLGTNHALMASALPTGFFNHQQPGLLKPELKESLVQEF